MKTPTLIVLGDLVDPVPQLGDAGVDAGVVRLAASDSPTHNSHLGKEKVKRVERRSRRKVPPESKCPQTQPAWGHRSHPGKTITKAVSDQEESLLVKLDILLLCVLTLQESFPFCPAQSM